MKPRLAPKRLCSGCTACRAICPKGAITMRPDQEGFLRPVIEEEKCIECHKCQSVCHVLNERKRRFPIECYAAKSRSDVVRKISSSGGVFSELASSVLRHGGCVFGCVLEEGTLRAVHIKAESERELAPMRGSKYVQSELSEVFEEVRRELEGGREVLFSGTPCQVAGLKSYLGREYANLILLGVICHGVTSPRLLEKYKLEMERKYGGRLREILFRSKYYSWKQSSVALKFYNVAECIREIFYWNSYMLVFNADVAHRYSCYHCKAHAGRCGSDILIGDFWNMDGDDDYGISAVCAYTEKGRQLVESSNLDTKQVEFDLITKGNRTVQNEIACPLRRYWFYWELRLRSISSIAYFLRFQNLQTFWLKRKLAPFYFLCRKLIQDIIVDSKKAIKVVVK